MKECTKCGEVKPLSEYHKRGNRLQSNCRTCMAAMNRAWYERNKERKRAAVAQWRAANADAYAASCNEYRERTREQQREAVRRWDAANPAVKNAHSAARRCRLRLAMPPWCDTAEVLAIYEAAKRTSDETGVPHEVDHIVPLKGKTVSGLHVPWNLRVIPRQDNRRKGAKHFHTEQVFA